MAGVQHDPPQRLPRAAERAPRPGRPGAVDVQHQPVGILERQGLELAAGPLKAHAELGIAPRRRHADLLHEPVAHFLDLRPRQREAAEPRPNVALAILDLIRKRPTGFEHDAREGRIRPEPEILQGGGGPRRLDRWPDLRLRHLDGRIEPRQDARQKLLGNHPAARQDARRGPQGEGLAANEHLGPIPREAHRLRVRLQGGRPGLFGPAPLELQEARQPIQRDIGHAVVTLDHRKLTAEGPLAPLGRDEQAPPLGLMPEETDAQEEDAPREELSPHTAPSFWVMGILATPGRGEKLS